MLKTAGCVCAVNRELVGGTGAPCLGGHGLKIMVADDSPAETKRAIMCGGSRHLPESRILAVPADTGPSVLRVPSKRPAKINDAGPRLQGTGLEVSAGRVTMGPKLGCSDSQEPGNPEK